jgi:hypothetical protein
VFLVRVRWRLLYIPPSNTLPRTVFIPTTGNKSFILGNIMLITGNISKVLGEIWDIEGYYTVNFSPYHLNRDNNTLHIYSFSIIVIVFSPKMAFNYDFQIKSHFGLISFEVNTVKGIS